MSIIIKEGCFYRTRGGQRVGPMRLHPHNTRVMVGDMEGHSNRCFALDGTHEYGNQNLDLIALWSDEPTSPVRTVTRKEIVPGTYGRISVASDADGYASIALTTFDTGPSQLDEVYRRSLKAPELRAAAKVFTDLADALEGGAP